MNPWQRPDAANGSTGDMQLDPRARLIRSPRARLIHGPRGTARPSPTRPERVHTAARRPGQGSLFRLLATALLPVLAMLGVLLPASQAEAQSPPRVTSVAFTNSPMEGDTYEVGEAIEVAVQFDAAVTVTGSPRLALAIGSRTRLADHAGGGQSALYFSYTVQASDRDTNGAAVPANAIRLDGATITAAEGAVNPSQAARAPRRPAFPNPIPMPTWLELGPGSIWHSATRSA